MLIAAGLALVGLGRLRLAGRKNRRAFLVQMTALLLAFSVLWLASAVFLRPWQLRDLTLWPVDNVLRVFDVADVMEIYEVRLHGVRQDSPPKLVSIDYELIVDSDESDRRLELLHTNVRKYGTVSNTLDAAVTLSGVVKRG